MMYAVRTVSFSYADLGGGKWHVAVDGTPFEWNTFAVNEKDLIAILEEQRGAWDRKLNPQKKKVGQAMKEAQEKTYGIRKATAAA